MPTRPSAANQRIPGGLSGLGRFPQGKIPRAVFLVFVDIDPGSIEHSAEIFLRKLSILRKLCDAEVIRPIVGAVGEVFVDQLGYEVRHLRNVLGTPCENWLLDAE